ncbi:MAG: tRNA pseudouridine(55) synthase TruB [Candidatus Woesebacteria bacterium]|jgi:tRNA pseudouridine55 synthase
MKPNGIILVDKPEKMSSFGVVARVRRVLSQAAGKKIKIGHTGTLDPFATGLMILVVGDYCKKAAEFSKLDKTYLATACLGQTSSTGDPEGDILQQSTHIPAKNDVINALDKFRGRITQTPPVYSAIKIDGQRAYKLARDGKEVEMPKRQVDIYNIELLNYDYPNVNFVCDVSSGTYIRTLVEDIGKQLRVGAYTCQLRRTKVGKWSIDQAQSLEECMLNPNIIQV